MALTAGARLGPYEIQSAVGAGGMGEVYRARDTRLDRTVAIKVLPETLAADPERIARFEREAKMLAALNQPNIAQIYGVEESTGVRALVMELVEGPTLADRIAQGPIPLDEALPIAKQIAEALEAAHEQGIIHRDLKPTNIKVRPDGAVKVLDFGLAKAFDPPSGARPDVTSSPTITTPAMTQAGIILGTAAYMAPEQARGLVLDRGADIWAFGCVLYEMLTGHRAFDGADVSETLASVLKSEPDWNALATNLPNEVRALAQACLRKNRRERLRDISTALFLLNQPVAGPAAPTHDLRRKSLWRRGIPLAAAVLIGAAAATAIFWKPRGSPSAMVTRFVITLPPGQQLGFRQSFAISPDGTRVAYAANGRLFLRLMSEVEPREIAGAESAFSPVFSPDSQSLAFWADGMLKRISISGGAAVSIYRTSAQPAGMAWDTSGILFGDVRTRIMRVSPNGGKTEVLVDASDTDTLIYGPQLLPDTDTLLFSIAQRANGDDPWNQAQIVVQSMKRRERKTLIDGGTDARWVQTGHIVYWRNGTLFAVPFDPVKLAMTADSVPVVEDVRRTANATSGGADFSVSNTGSLLYRLAPPGGRQALALFHQNGRAEPLKLPKGSYTHPRVSPDGKRLAFETDDDKEKNISIYELSGASAVRRLTFGGNNRFPLWSADGQRVAFQSDRDGDPAVFWQPADGGPAEQLTKPDAGTSHTPESWSPTGDPFLFSVAKGSQQSLWTYSVRERKATPFDGVRSTTFPPDAVFSPDGRWVAYQTGEAGQGEGTTYVQPFPSNGTKYQIARGGRPLWSRQGTLLYIPSAGQLMSVSVRTQPTFSFTSPVAVPRGFGIADPLDSRSFDIMPDGRIVGNGTVWQNQTDSPESSQMRVVLNWGEELKRLVPVK